MDERDMQMPAQARRLLRLVVRADRSDEILDDLDELYRSRRESDGFLVASLRVWADVLSVCIRPAFWRRPNPDSSHSTSIRILLSMILTDLRTAVRGIRKRAGFSVLNALGLGVGLACVFFIALFVRNELAFDRHHDRGDRIVRVVANYYQSGRHWAPIGPPVGIALAESHPDVERVARFFPFESETLVHIGEEKYLERRAGMADSTYFDVFTFEFVAGDPRSALTRPGQVVISESLARKYFGRSDVVGESILFSGEDPGVVSGVFKDLPPTTHQPVDMLLSMETFYADSREWLESAITWAGFHTYLLLRPGVDADALESKLPAFVDEFYAGRLGDTPSDALRLELQPLHDIHLHSSLEKEYVANSDIRYVYTFTGVALIVLLIAVVNFVNLSTARSTLRMREIGVRRSFGAARSSLIRQFLTESVVHSLMGFVVASGLVLLFFPFFVDIAGVAFDRSVLLDPVVAGVFLAGAVVVGVVAGVYPAFFLSRFRPVEAFQGRTFAPGGGLRTSLVVGQFAVSIVLIAVSVVVWSQLSFLRNAQLGFDKEHVLVVDMSTPMAEAMTNSPQAFREAVEAHPAVIAVSQASDLPGARYSLEGMSIVGRDDTTTMMRVAWRSDYDYVDALGLELVEGRGFSEQAPADTSAWILNEAAVDALGLDDPTNESLRWDNYVGPIVGVVRNFNFASLHNPVEPLVIPLRPGYGGVMLVRYRGEEDAVLAHTREALAALTPGELFDYTFLAEKVDQQYAREDDLRDVISWFSGLGIAVACLGLFGLAAFTADRRKREIGIRKVLGASARQIVTLLTREFAMHLIVAMLISVPIAYVLMHRWLAEFAYRIDLSPAYFAAAGASALIVAMLTVALQATRAAAVDPVESIRHE